MSDLGLRELERRWRETGAVEDEAAYLRECVRVGYLMPESLELAAYCGHEGAACALAHGAVQHHLSYDQETQLLPEGGWREFANWVLGLAKWGSALPVMAVLAAYDMRPIGSTEADRYLGAILRAVRGRLTGRVSSETELRSISVIERNRDPDKRSLLFGAEQLYQATQVLDGTYQGGMATEGARDDHQAICKLLVLALSSLRSAKEDALACKVSATQSLMPVDLGRPPTSDH